MRIFDTHTHLVTDDFANYPLIEPGAPGGHTGVPANPAGVNLRERITAAPLTAEAVLALWSEAGVAGGVAVQYRTAYGVDNSYLLDSAARHPDQIRPVIVVDAAGAETPGRLRSLAGRHRLAGIRITGGMTPAGEFPWLDSEDALATLAEADRLGLPIVIMSVPPGTNEAALRRIGGVADRLPGAQIVIDHVGWPVDGYHLRSAHAELADRPNINVKVTTENFDQVAEANARPSGFLRRAVDLFGADRVMWGSDYGNAPGSYADLLGRALDAVTELTDAEQDAVLGGTGRRLFG
ncbi:MAG: amidohydrolase family protein [Nocardioides sp.]|uniref:amidohydrolase family protein n=1 Tax=Nocardioides sp. TaxID=35761 RepID=UPI0039E485C5